ncbi:Na/Pi cotransporter family protein, partial [Candidatus Altiarchaeota archaeon]
KVGNLFLYLIVAGFFGSYLLKGKAGKLSSNAVLGLGLLLMGMHYMSSGAKVLCNAPQLVGILAILNQNPYLGVAFGAVFTAIVQSSSAMTGLVIAMGAAGTINLPFAIALILGANIGTCVTGVIAALDSKLSAKRASLAQVVINVFGVLLFLPFLNSFSSIVASTSTYLPRQIANAHTIFNILVSMLAFPLVPLLVRSIKKILPGDPVQTPSRVKFIEDKVLNMIPIALLNSRKEVDRLGELSLKMLEDSVAGLLGHDRGKIDNALEQEDMIDKITLEIQVYLNKITARTTNEGEIFLVNTLRNSIIDMERVSDLANNIGEVAGEMMEEGINMGEDKQENLERLTAKVIESYETALRALKADDVSLARRVLVLEDEIDLMEHEMRIQHSKEDSAECDTYLGTIYVELLKDLERVGDHANNIVDNILDDK